MVIRRRDDRAFFRPFGAWSCLLFLPTACAVGCILALLRSWGGLGGLARWCRRVLCVWFRRAYGTRFRVGAFPSAEALGYFRASLWDDLLRRLRGLRVLRGGWRFLEIVCWYCRLSRCGFAFCFLLFQDLAASFPALPEVWVAFHYWLGLAGCDCWEFVFGTCGSGFR